MKSAPKSSIEQLSAKERELLALFYGTDTHKALRKLIDVERLELAKDHLEQTDILLVRYLSGQAMSLKRLVKTLSDNYKTFNKKS